MGNKLFGFTIVSALIAVAVVRGGIPSLETVNKQAIVEQIIYHTVEIDVILGESKGIGSGVLYVRGGKIYVLTAAHVVGDGTGLYIVKQTDPNNETLSQYWTGNVVACDSDSDWAILELQGESRPVRGASFVPVRAWAGEEVYTSGSPMGEENTITEGIVANNKRSVPWNSDKHLVVTCNGCPGSSGGGVYDKITGECIGIVVRLNTASRLLYIVPIETILNDLQIMGKISIAPS